MLSQLLLQALKYHPNNVSWLKLMADLMFGKTMFLYSCKNSLSNFLSLSTRYQVTIPQCNEKLFYVGLL